MKFCIKTYGCQMNERDTEAASAVLIRDGHEQVQNEAEAELVIVNTCSVRAKAEHKALGKLGMLTATKKAMPGRIVGVMGCMVERAKAELFRKVESLDFAIGTHMTALLPEIVRAVRDNGSAGRLVLGDNEGPRNCSEDHINGRISTFVNVLLGCNRRCSYCVVPLVRGREWSRPASEVIREARQAVANGAREVTLLGQSVMSYGQANAVWGDEPSPLGFKEPLPRLLEAVEKVEGLERVRFTSGHPSGCSLELARAISELPKVCEHLHLPVQSGSDRILKLMRRGYTREDYLAAVARLKAAAPDISLTTDFIVGFPSETEEEFQQTMSLLNEVRFDNSYIFKYSPRPGTAAADMPDELTAEEKMRRNHVLLDRQNEIGLENNEALVGTEQEVLLEGRSSSNGLRWSGRTRTNKIVLFEPAGKEQPGCICRVGIDRAMAQTLYGRL